MRIIIDIAHPAHIHYFRNFAKIMEGKGHKYLFTLRGKQIIVDLAEYYNLNYKIRSSIEKEAVSKQNYALTSIKNIYKISRNFNPDLFVDMGTVFSAPVAKFLRVPHIAFQDTERAFKARLLLFPFTSCFLTPDCYLKNLGKRQIRFNGYMELLYLRNNYFHADENILNELSIKRGQKVCVVRFVAWKAFHDKGQKGFSENEKVEFIKEISKRARVFISSESDSVNEELRPFVVKIHPGKLHSLIAYSSLYIGEGATMASEASVLGVPAIYFNTIDTGYLKEQEKYGVVFHYKNYNDVLAKSIELLEMDNLKEEWEIKHQRMLSDKIDVTAFLVWFVENYPESFIQIKSNPGFFNNFKQQFKIASNY